MTPMRFAREECANMTPDGSCLGIDVKSLSDNNGPAVASPRDTCLVAEGERCPYFETCVLPLADRPSPPGNPRLQDERLAARAVYLKKRRLSIDEPENERRCPDCGTILARRARYCESCAAKRRRATYRDSKRRGR